MAITVGEIKKRIQAGVDFNPRMTSDVMLRLIKDRIRDIAMNTQAYRKQYDIFVGISPVEKQYLLQTEDNLIDVFKIEYGTSDDFSMYNQKQQPLEKSIDYTYDFVSDLATTVQGLRIRLLFDPSPNYYIRVFCVEIPENNIDAIWTGSDNNPLTSIIPETFIDALIKGVLYLWKREYDRDPYLTSYMKEYEDARDIIGRIRNERMDLL